MPLSQLVPQAHRPHCSHACRQSSHPTLLQPGLIVRLCSYCMGCTNLMLPNVAYTPFGPVMQGAFILVGNNSFGYPLLVVMAVGVLIYACWRFWEGITGQGSDDAFGPFKNFFRYRLSPIVSVRHCSSRSALRLPGVGQPWSGLCQPHYCFGRRHLLQPCGCWQTVALHTRPDLLPASSLSCPSMCSADVCKHDIVEEQSEVKVVCCPKTGVDTCNSYTR